MLNRINLLLELLVFLECRGQYLLPSASFLLTVELADLLLRPCSEVSNVAIKVRIDTFVALIKLQLFLLSNLIVQLWLSVVCFTEIGQFPRV